MVTLLNPPTPRTPLKTHAEVLASHHEKRIEAEITQLLSDIRRIGPTHPPGSPHVLFGELFDDDAVQQYYEALVGTLKSAKKRGVITFKGQMLLKGMHDKVVISVVELDESPSSDTKTRDSPTRPLRNDEATAKTFTFSPLRASPKRSSMAPEQRPENATASSDAEVEVQNRNHQNLLRVASSDSELNAPSGRLRGRVALPSAFVGTKPLLSDANSRPPAPSKRRKAQSTASFTCFQSSTSVPNFRYSKRSLDIQPEPTNDAIKVVKGRNDATKPVVRPLSELCINEVPKGNLRAISASTNMPSISKPNVAKASSVKILSTEAFSRVDSEVHQLVKDICRVGANPGLPSVTFGELFDDDEVQQTYEALVGTLRSAKRQGLIDFKGQVLFKGVHDKVVIHVVQG